jgi:hypothetical protein
MCLHTGKIFVGEVEDAAGIIVTDEHAAAVDFFNEFVKNHAFPP